ncbi:MAG: hypothetical protein AAF388_00820 [Bacteroidota bacterium]
MKGFIFPELKQMLDVDILIYKLIINNHFIQVTNKPAPTITLMVKN